MKKGLIHLYTGEGKGKTTAALGLCLRAAGRGRKVLWTSFLKDYDSGEFMGTLPFEVFYGDRVTKFWFVMTEDEKLSVINEHAWRITHLFDRAREEKIELLALDETLGAISVGALSERLVLSLLEQKPDSLEVVLTGRAPSQALVDASDYVSRIEAVKHPYESGVPAREGIEY